MHADRTNRFLLILLGLLLLVAGLAGALAGFGAFGASTARRTLGNNQVWTFFGKHGDWLWLIAAVIAVLIALLALRWLQTVLLSTDRAGDLPVSGDRKLGRTQLSAAALSEAVTGELDSYPGVHSARARLIGDAANPTLVLNVSLEQSTDLGGLRRRIETGAVAHARQALAKPDLPVRLDLRVVERQAHRVG